MLGVLVVGLDVGKLMMEVGTLVLRRLGAVRFGILAPAPQSSATGVLVLLGRVGNRTPASCDGALVNLLEDSWKVAYAYLPSSTQSQKLVLSSVETGTFVLVRPFWVKIG